MKKLFENWRRFVNESQGQHIGSVRKVGTDLYRISKRYGDSGDNLERFKTGDKVIRSRDSSADDGLPYTNAEGQQEHRIYFFSSENDAKAVIFSDIEELEAIVGDFSDEDKAKGINNNLLLVRIPSSDVPDNIQFFTDPELEDTPYDAVYGSSVGGKPWSLRPAPNNISTIQDIIDSEEEYDDEYY